MSAFSVVIEEPDVAQTYVPILVSIAPAGQPAQDTRFLMNQTLVTVGGLWRIASSLPIPVPPPAQSK